jgi:glycosyltransferase involved in cell wall biosynthesis
MKVAFIIPARDKEGFVADAVSAAFAQTYSPMEIIISDQGSTDKTLEIIKDLVSKYDGQNEVKILNCPHTENKGMVGLNIHLNWIHSVTDADIYIISSADDVAYPTRSEKVVKAFKEFNPSMVLNAQRFIHPNGNNYSMYPIEDRFINGSECLNNLIGGSSACAWSRDFYDKVGPLSGICAQDVYLSFLATLDKGTYYLSEVLHDFIRHEDANNTGLGGVVDAAKTEDEKLQITENMHFQILTTLFMAGNKLEEMEWLHDEKSRQTLFEHIVIKAMAWSKTRHDITIKKLPVRSFVV